MTATPRELALLLQHAGWVHELARALVGDAHRAEELAQDTLLAAWMRPPADARSPRGWLASVLRSLWRDARRRDELRRAREADAARAEAVESANDVLERAAVHKRLVELVMELDEASRTVLLMRYFDGLAPKRIAEILAVPEATVRSRLRRGLERLREHVDARSGGDRRAWLGALVPGVLGSQSKATALVATAKAASWAPGTGWMLMQMNAKLVVALLAVAGAAIVVPRWLAEHADAPRLDASAATLESGEVDEGAEPPFEASRAERALADPAEHAAREAESASRDAHPPATAAPDRSPERLALVAESFLTDRPDIGALADVVEELAAESAVVEGSVATDRDGVVTGRLSAFDGALEGSFRIEGERYGVRFESLLGTEREDALIKRDLSLGWKDEGGRAEPAGATIQFHPLTNQDVRDHLEPGEEAFVGWTVKLDAQGATRSPLTMRISDDGRSWVIGHPSTPTSVHEPGIFEGGAWDAWLRKLRPLATQ